MDELIVPRFGLGLAFIECEDEDAKIFVKMYDLITRCYDKKQFLTQQTPNAKFAKGLAKDFEYVNSFVNYPVDFIPKGKYVIIIRKDSPNYDLIKDVPNTAHAVELLLAAINGGEEVCKRVLESRKLGVEPKTKMHKDGQIEVRYAEVAKE